MGFIQMMRVRAPDGEAVANLMREWHQAEIGVAPGYLGSRLLGDRDNPGHYIAGVYFSSYEEAMKNNDRAETQEWAAKFNAVIDGEPEFANYDELANTG